MKSWLEVDAERLKGNFHAVQAAAGPEYEVLAVIKANAYGHGAELCAPVLVEAGARWLGVTDVDEGVAVRAALRETFGAESEAVKAVRLLVMCGFEPDDAQAMVTHELTPVVWTPEHLETLQAVCKASDCRVRVHLEIDTGMARQGARPGPELAAFYDTLQRCSRVMLEGTFTHLSSAEVVGGEQTQAQMGRFRFAGSVSLSGWPEFPELLHVGNTSAVDEGSTLDWLRAETWQRRSEAMVRTGLALYGYVLPLEGGQGGVAGEGRLRPLVQPVGTWKTRVIGLRGIEAGDTVGYGATFTAERPMRLALLPVGYAEGFRREASSGVGDGWVMIAGERAKVVGRVSMNLTIVDVTALPACALGDEVVLLGQGVTAEDHARWCGTIPYEIFCGMRAERRLV